MNRARRFEGHSVGGFGISCDISPNGQVVASGSSDGCVYFYDWKSSRLLKRIQVHDDVCMDVAFHPAIPTVVATAAWDRKINVFM